jgi:hypothetical protein
VKKEVEGEKYKERTGTKQEHHIEAGENKEI